MIVLGVDPTATGTGAAVLREGGWVLGWWAWTRVKRGWRIREGTAPEVLLDVGHVRIGEHIGFRACAIAPPDRLIVEGLHVPPRWARRASGADVLVLAEATGATIAGLRARLSCGEPLRPTAREWRAAFGWARLGASAAENAAMQRARLAGWLPRGLTIAEQGAVAEAGAIAEFGAVG